MKAAGTAERMRRECDPGTLEAIRAGTAPAEVRRAFVLGLLVGASESLAAAPIVTQTDWVDTQPAEKTRGGETQNLLF